MRLRPSTQARMYAPAIFVALGGTLVFWRRIDEGARGVILVAIGCIVVLLVLSSISGRRTRRLLAKHEQAIDAIRRGEDVSELYGDDTPRRGRSDAA